MARGGPSEEEGTRGAPKRRSWSDVVSSFPPAATISPVKARTEIRVAAGMPKPSSSVNKQAKGSPGKECSPQKVFSADEVARLVEITRNQLRKEKELSSGWKEVTSRDSKHKEKNYARDLVEGYRSSPESSLRCWQCDLPGHKSADCPKGERCFVCNCQGHKRAECPVKRRATRKEKGKAVEVMQEAPRRRPSIGIHIADQWPSVGRGNDLPKQPTHQVDAGNNIKEKSQNKDQVWKKVPETKGKPSLRPGRQNEAGEAGTTLHRPGRQAGNLQENERILNSNQQSKGSNSRLGKG